MGFMVLHMNVDGGKPIFVRPKDIVMIMKSDLDDSTCISLSNRELISVKETMEEVAALCVRFESRCSMEEAERAVSVGLGNI